METEPADALEALGDELELTTPTRRMRMLVIVNPYATTVSDRLRHLVVYALRGRYDLQAVDTQAPGHATQLCREAAQEGYDVIVAFGGDGTVNEAANGLVGSDVALTCLPGGSTSVFCQMLGIPADIVDATEHLLGVADRFQPRTIDLGHVNGRYFTFSSGMGLDASVVARIDANPALKSRFGAWYATYAGLSTFMGSYVMSPPRLNLEIDGHRTADGVTLLVQNGDPYTYFNTLPLRVAEGGGLQTGTLAGAMLTSSRPTVLPGVVWRLLHPRARVIGHRSVESFQDATELVVRADRPVPVHVDGDHIGDLTEARYGVTPQALKVVA